MIKVLIDHMRKIHNRPTGWVDMKTFVLLSFVCKKKSVGGIKTFWAQLNQFRSTEKKP